MRDARPPALLVAITIAWAALLVVVFALANCSSPEPEPDTSVEWKTGWRMGDYPEFPKIPYKYPRFKSRA